MKDPAGLFLIPMGLFSIYRGVQGYRRGRISWIRGPSEFWMAYRDDDPVSFTTGVWLYILTGALALWMAYWVAFA
jgi:hypothetical protein